MKVPCGGFDLDESVFNVDKNSKQIKLNSPISYDYMPEGYPSKGIEYVTLMEEQEVAFSEHGSLMGANSPVDLEIKLGDKLTVVWDGASYNVTVKVQEMGGPSGALAFGNLGLTGLGDTEDYPFVYMMFGSNAQWAASDTAASHTIKVMRQQETITPMSTDFMPKNLNVVFRGELGHAPTSCNVTYNELRDWVERDIPVFAVFIIANAKFNITSISLLTDGLVFIYYLNGSTSKSFVYKSDGTFVIQ